MKKQGTGMERGWFGCYLIAPEPCGAESGDDQPRILSLFFTNDKGCRKPRRLGLFREKGNLGIYASGISLSETLAPGL